MENYVKFLRGTPKAYEALPIKDKQTLYFICETNSKKGKLYLGDVLISTPTETEIPTVTSLSLLEDVLIKEPNTNDILKYNKESGKWENTNLSSLLENEIMVGATQEADGEFGFVPTPKRGEQDYYLSGAGEWKDLNGIYITNETYEKDMKEIEKTIKWGSFE